jgi:hypothetical protein
MSGSLFTLLGHCMIEDDGYDARRTKAKCVWHEEW